MKHQLVLIARQQILREVYVGLDVLGVGDVEHAVLPLVILPGMKQTAARMEQVARRLQIGLHGDTPVVVAVAEAYLHDEQVFVVVAQDGVVARGVLQILLSEGVADPGHEHVVQVYQVQLVLVVVVLRIPPVVPPCRHHPPVELRTVLRVVEQRQLAGGYRPPAYLPAQEGHDESREAQPALQTVLDEVLVAVALQPSDGLIGSAQPDAQRLRSPEQVAVLIGQRGGGSQVARRVGALRLEADGRRLVGLQVHLCVERSRISRRLETDVRIAHGSQAPEVVIGVLQVILREVCPRLQEGILTEHSAAQMYHRVIGSPAGVGDVAYLVARVGRRQSLARAIGLQYQCQVHLPVLSQRVSPEGDILLVEPVVAVVAQERRQPRALIVQRIHVEPHALPQPAVVSRQQPRDGRVLDVVAHRPHIVGLAWVQHVDGVQLLPFPLGIELHLRIQVAQVLQCQLQVVARQLRLHRVEDHRGLTQALQRAIDPFGRIAARQRIDAQGYLQRREPARVALLPHIFLQLRGIDVTILAVGHHLHPVEQHLAVGDVTRGRTRAQQEHAQRQ